ncbi:hypothetical protein TNCV_4691331 [Trichonephila clavipes]|nr:hypothetical protein TNCV_4691331 [Trichonephila clavipes]
MFISLDPRNAVAPRNLYGASSRREKLNWKVMPRNEGGQAGPCQLVSLPIKFPGRYPLNSFHIQSCLIGERIRFAHFSPNFSPFPLVLENNKPVHLNSTLTPYLVPHLEGYKSPCHIDTGSISLP